MKTIKSKREKQKIKEDNEIYRAIFIDNGKITIMQIAKKDLAIEVLKHETLSSFTKIN